MKTATQNTEEVQVVFTKHEAMLHNSDYSYNDSTPLTWGWLDRLKVIAKNENFTLWAFLKGKKVYLSNATENGKTFLA